MIIETLADFFKNICIPVFGYLSNFAQLVLEFLFRDFNGQPLIYYLFGAGLIAFLVAKITISIVS